MIILGLICLIAGYLLGVGVVVTIGWILLAVGIILAILGMVGRPVGGRSWYW